MRSRFILKGKVKKLKILIINLQTWPKLVIRGEFKPGKENINKQIKMPDGKHKIFKEVTKFTG